MGGYVANGTLMNKDCDVDDLDIDGDHAEKNSRGKLPKKVLKAERERLKREQLNVHFNRLASVLELSDQNTGKASILNETIRLVNDMLSQIQGLRKENATLLSESHYITAEKNEVKDENSVLEAQIKKMKSELEERINQYKPDLNLTPPESWQVEMDPQLVKPHLTQIIQVDPSSTQNAPVPGPGPLYVIPVGPDLQVFEKADTASNPPVPVRKPHARYPTPADSWPLHLLLSKQPEATP